MTALTFTPSIEELLPDHKVKCQQPNCESVFTNKGNYELHLLKRHKIAVAKDDRPRLYHCPHADCVYHVRREKHFKNLKYLRQHFQKVHTAKTHCCDRCGLGFPSAGMLSTHSLKVCGRKFVCNKCGWDYNTMEALLTHAKRKGHVVEKSITEKKKTEKLVTKDETAKSHSHDKETQDLPTEGKHQDVLKSEQQTGCVPLTATVARSSPEMLANNWSTTQQHQATQTQFSKHLRVAGVQTDAPATTALLNTTVTGSSELDDIHSLLRNIETQTELTLRSSPPSSSNSVLIDQMFAPSSHMHTQTCDEFLTELGLADIQTQTNWSALTGSDDKHEYASIATSTGCAHDELLVSTETQTSFTQCLLDSCHTTSTAVGGDGSFGGLYTTQHTQTCDTLLESLFGAQENDLIGGFQSTYTQT